MKYLAILGRQPALGLAELESLYGAAAIRPAGSIAAVLDMEAGQIDFDRLGGCLKLARVITTLDTTDWRAIESYLVGATDSIFAEAAEGKILLGLSAYDLRVSPQNILATGLTLKKLIKQSGHPVRLIPNKDTELNSASVLHNGLTQPNGYELLCLRDGQQTIIAQTLAVQDIESYTIRDRDRPKRDAKVGMLPPKLAQIIINLANPTTHGVVLDPFCGTGVLLQEALLMDYNVYGSDLEPRMIEYSQANLDWLKSHQSWLAKNVDEHKSTGIFLEVQDATSFVNHYVIDAVASETYLGRPFTTTPDAETLNQTMTDCNLIIKKFLRTIHPQLARGTRLCLAIPAWQVRRDQFKHLPLLDSLRDLGYNRISFEHARTEDLLYYRSDQIVARELLTVEKL